MDRQGPDNLKKQKDNRNRKQQNKRKKHAHKRKICIQKRENNARWLNENSEQIQQIGKRNIHPLFTCRFVGWQSVHAPSIDGAIISIYFWITMKKIARKTRRIL